MSAEQDAIDRADQIAFLAFELGIPLATWQLRTLPLLLSEQPLHVRYRRRSR